MVVLFPIGSREDWALLEAAAAPDRAAAASVVSMIT
jgi:hypothetical protein